MDDLQRKMNQINKIAGELSVKCTKTKQKAIKNLTQIYFKEVMDYLDNEAYAQAVDALENFKNDIEREVSSLESVLGLAECSSRIYIDSNTYDET